MALNSIDPWDREIVEQYSEFRKTFPIYESPVIYSLFEQTHSKRKLESRGDDIEQRDEEQGRLFHRTRGAHANVTDNEITSQGQSRYKFLL